MVNAFSRAYSNQIRPTNFSLFLFFFWGGGEGVLASRLKWDERGKGQSFVWKYLRNAYLTSNQMSGSLHLLLYVESLGVLMVKEFLLWTYLSRRNCAQAKNFNQSICFRQSCSLSGRQLFFSRGIHSSNANKDISTTGTTLILSLLMTSISCFPNKNTTQQAWQH